jgi:hypothetical protein
VLELAIELHTVAQHLLQKVKDPHSAINMLQKVISDREDSA